MATKTKRKTTKTYDLNDLTNKLKISRATASKRAKEIDASRDELGYYRWTKPQFDKLIRKMRNDA